MTNKRRARSLAMLILLAAPLSAAGQQTTAPQSARSDARQRNLQAYVELLRSDLRTAKIAIITEVVHFTDAEDEVFWPIYREYEFELSKQTDDRLRLIDTYAQVYARLTDAAADDLVVRMLDLESRRTALKQSYYQKLKAVLPARTAARVLQVENQIQLLVDLQIAASLPVARDAEEGAQ